MRLGKSIFSFFFDFSRITNENSAADLNRQNQQVSIWHTKNKGVGTREMRRFRKIITAAALCWTISVAQAKFVDAQTATGEAKQALMAELTSKLDTKSAKVGDVVIAKTVTESRMTDGSTIPKRSKLEGKVTQVESKAAGDGNASVAILFDHLEVKGGQQKPIHGVLLAIAPRPSLSDQEASSGSLPQASTRSVGTTAAATGGAFATGGGEQQPEIMAPGSTVKGVQLDTKLTTDGSSVLRASNKDIHLESGMKIQVGLM
jgi:hypothetical protein